MIRAFRERVTDEDVAHLARLTADGDSALQRREDAADIASTGGPGSLSTLLCPLYLRALGYTVPKLAVPGRPAGGVDALATVPRYRVHLTAADVHRVLDDCGYAHFVADRAWVPLDAFLFEQRRRIDAESIPELVMASLLAKKIATGVRRAGFDVRVTPHGNFGADLERAVANAKRLVHVASKLQIDATCLLTETSQPLQPYVGRGEALVALRSILFGEVSGWLQRHVGLCTGMVRSFLERTELAVSVSDLRRHFEENLVSQGSSLELFLARTKEVMVSPRTGLRMEREGYLAIDLGILRDVLSNEQGKATREFADPVGVEFLVEPGLLVRRGEEVAVVRGTSPEHTRRMAALIAPSLRTVATAPSEPGPIVAIRG